MTLSDEIEDRSFKAVMINSQKRGFVPAIQEKGSICSELSFQHLDPYKVKQFIKGLKDFAPYDSRDIKRFLEYIKKLAGPKLTEELNEFE